MTIDNNEQEAEYKILDLHDMIRQLQDKLAAAEKTIADLGADLARAQASIAALSKEAK